MSMERSTKASLGHSGDSNSAMSASSKKWSWDYNHYWCHCQVSPPRKPNGLIVRDKSGCGFSWAGAMQWRWLSFFCCLVWGQIWHLFPIERKRKGRQWVTDINRVSCGRKSSWINVKRPYKVPHATFLSLDFDAQQQPDANSNMSICKLRTGRKLVKPTQHKDNNAKSSFVNPHFPPSTQYTVNIVYKVNKKTSWWAWRDLVMLMKGWILTSIALAQSVCPRPPTNQIRRGRDIFIPTDQIPAFVRPHEDREPTLFTLGW